MAKGIKDKEKKRFRSARRHKIENTILRDRRQEQYDAIMKRAQGISTEEPKKVNGFLHPNDPNASIPQVPPKLLIDFRANVVPMAVAAKRGSRRLFSKEQKTELMARRTSELDRLCF